MNKEQEQQILDYYSTADKYIHSKLHSNAHQSVFTKENDKYQWLVLEQKSQNQVEVRQTATLYARDKAVMRKLDTLVADFPDIYKLIEQDEVSKAYSFPKSYVSYCKPRNLSNDQRERARLRMTRINSINS